MCRIDAAYANNSLEEKKDHTERFLQILDECKIEGNFRSLLIKHLSANWQNEFLGISKLEEALNKANRHKSDKEKCTALLSSEKDLLNLRLIHYFNGAPIQDSALFNFLHDVAQTYFLNSPYGLFLSVMNPATDNYFLFVSWVYGKNFCLSQVFFDDETLSALNWHERTTILWDCFYSMAPVFRNLGYQTDQSTLFKELTSIASTGCISGPPTNDSLKILRGFEFIKAWIEFDAQAGRLTYCLNEFFYSIGSPWERIESLVRSEGNEHEGVSDTLSNWLDVTRREFEKLSYVNAELKSASDIEVKRWVRGLDGYLNHIYLNFDYSQPARDEFDLRMSNELGELCSQLTPFQLGTWIKYSVKEEFQQLLNSKQNSPKLSNTTEKWIHKDYLGAWKNIFLESLHELDLRSQLKVLSAYGLSGVCQSKELYLDLSGWWNELIGNLIENDNFPKDLIPGWTIVAMDKLDREKWLPYIDKSIGILRGKVIQDESAEANIPSYHEQLATLLQLLDKTNPTKAFRHRLFLSRSSKVAFSDESLSRVRTWDHDYDSDWCPSFNELAHNQFAYQVNSRKIVITGSPTQAQSDFLIAFSNEFAEFCLSRLRLRKGEKSQDGKYDSSQVIETSPIWRQGYLKVLVELGFDLNGKVHKTVNFTKKSDPDKDVRAIAGECYKAVRRHAKKSPTIQDLKRGIIAAEWWLLICQRQELELNVNYEEALKTRRKQLRNL
jgi:hypothetical protein